MSRLATNLRSKAMAPLPTCNPLSSLGRWPHIVWTHAGHTTQPCSLMALTMASVLTVLRSSLPPPARPWPCNDELTTRPVTGTKPRCMSAGDAALRHRYGFFTLQKRAIGTASLCLWDPGRGSGLPFKAFRHHIGQHRADARPETSKKEFSQKCRAQGYVMKQRVTALNLQRAARALADSSLLPFSSQERAWQALPTTLHWLPM